MSEFVICDNDLDSFPRIRTGTAQVFESAGEGLLGTKVVVKKTTTATAEGAMKTVPVIGLEGQ